MQLQVSWGQRIGQKWNDDKLIHEIIIMRELLAWNTAMEIQWFWLSIQNTVSGRPDMVLNIEVSDAKFTCIYIS